jgi:outer membrane protein assembly factor BamB
MTLAHVRVWIAGGVLLLAALADCSNATDPGHAVSASTKPLQPVGWRNDGSGRFPLATPPLEWSASKNIVWTTKIGPNRYSSPIVADRKVFLIADPAELFCVNAVDGKILWRRSSGFAELPGGVQEVKARGPAGNTTPTPVSDGNFVYVAFGTGIVACYDMQGTRKWIQHFNLKPATEYGRATSPVLADGKLLITLSFLIAIDTKTGKEVWRNKVVPELYGTPVVARIGGTDVAVMPSGQVVRVRDGALLATGLGGLSFASPIVEDDTVYLIQMASSAQQLLTLVPDKWKARQLWDQELEGTFYSSAVYDKGLIYAVSNENKFHILDAKDGKILAIRDLDFATANMYPSLALAGNHLFVLNDEGDALVLEPGRQYKELKRNHLGDGHGGAPAFEGKYIYIRSKQYLYCVGEK